MADRETRALSFGSVAADYDRYRPAPPSQALDWLIPPGAQAILDLAAGTGVVTRELIGRAARVVAVEPDERMRAVLTARCPQADVLAGRGEDIPLPSASVDAVVISAAWHWLDAGRAVPEITRVCVPAAGSASCGTPGTAAYPGWPSSTRWPASHERRTGHRTAAAGPAGVRLNSRRALRCRRSRSWWGVLTAGDLRSRFGLLGTYSGVITLDPGQRADFSRRVRAFLDRQPWNRSTCR